MTSDAVNPHKSDKSDERAGRQLSPEQAAAAAMVAEARQRGLELTGPGGLLKLFTKNVLETALNEEITEHLGHEKNRAQAGRARPESLLRPGVALRVLRASLHPAAKTHGRLGHRDAVRAARTLVDRGDVSP